MDSAPQIPLRGAVLEPVGDAAAPGAPENDPEGPASSLVWMRDTRGRPLDYPLLAAMADHAPPRVMFRRKAITSSSTVSMTTHFHATPAGACGGRQRLHPRAKSTAAAAKAATSTTS